MTHRKSVFFTQFSFLSKTFCVRGLRKIKFLLFLAGEVFSFLFLRVLCALCVLCGKDVARGFQSSTVSSLLLKFRRVVVFMVRGKYIISDAII